MLYFSQSIIKNKALVLLICLITCWGCRDTEQHIPTIYLKTGAPCTPDGATVAFNDDVVTGVVADGGGANITMLTVTVESETGKKTVLDSGTNIAVLDWTKAFPKGDGWNETWTFTVMNRDRQQASVSMHIYKDSSSAYGLITTYPSVILGCQSNTATRNFFDPVQGLYYFPAEVTTSIEPSIDIAFYYDASDSYTAFSPGCTSAELYYPCFTSWGTLNYTAWDIHTVVSAASFDNATNDSLIVASYDEVYGKKKYKFLTVGGVVPFKTAAGKKGLVKIISTTGNETGTVECAIKIQK